ncbi:tripartite tricarboxylate transporter substrate binding protein [Limnohabitans sp. 15K]|jgi:tripartite-type tricarboxylate transporter receptor subunit TctC|uniref:Bug family tripartite tricarboxylate transporter substrate binding protein n=1 Tax=Limnohabitans sp. 15K TaxID=1100706 RepID=UPI000C1EF54F|nr:tripartite tricarboxylate transporter substrate binding protein [Limnohabitans sp. 15K]PIT81558.1 TctC [Limnohabitans sp. 15K]
MQKSFRRACLMGSLALLVGTCAIAQNAPWPSKPVKFVNSFPPGGPSDILARAVGDVLQKQFNQPFVVENKPGAAGNVGADQVAKSAADGYSLLWGIDTTHTINPHIYKTMPFKEADLKPLVVLSSSGLLLGVHPSTGIKNVKDFMQAARDRSLNFSSGGNGSPGHLWVNISNVSASTRLVHVPYRGNSPAVMAVVSGEVDGGTLATPGMLPQVKGGKVTALAVTSRKRSRLAPDVPTMAEAGFKDLESEVLYVVMAPANTPEPLMQTMAKAITDAMAKPELQTRLNDLDMAYEGLTGSAAAARLSKLSDSYGRVIRATGMKVD